MGLKFLLTATEAPMKTLPFHAQSSQADFEGRDWYYSQALAETQSTTKYIPC